MTSHQDARGRFSTPLLAKVLNMIDGAVPELAEATISSARELRGRSAFDAPQLAACAEMLGEPAGATVTAELLIVDVRPFWTAAATDRWEGPHGDLRP